MKNKLTSELLNGIKTCQLKMFQSSVDVRDGFPYYEVRWVDKPQDWENQVIKLQNIYLSTVEETSPLSFGQTIEKLKELAQIHSEITIEKEEYQKAMVWSAMNMMDIYMLLSDNQVTEIFSNTIGNSYVISHLDYGRCITNLSFNLEFWNSLKIRAEFDTGQALTPETPAIKVGFDSTVGNLRISLQTAPLTPMGPTFNLRRLPASPITIEKLIKDKQISSEKAELLINAVKNRKNIVIAGEPGSGKTTLANSLLLKTDPRWRLILMEDAKEIIISPAKFPMAVNFSLPVVGEDDRYVKRINEISRLLHRSPDYVFLGELQNKDDTTVAFEGFAAGIRGIATTHAKSFQTLLSRWRASHNLNEDLLNSIEIIVITNREFIGGKIHLKVKEIYSNVQGEFEPL